MFVLLHGCSIVQAILPWVKSIHYFKIIPVLKRESTQGLITERYNNNIIITIQICITALSIPFLRLYLNVVFKNTVSHDTCTNVPGYQFRFCCQAITRPYILVFSILVSVSKSNFQRVILVILCPGCL